MFLSLDGIDGVGKSTQAARLVQWLREQGNQVVACRDPGSTCLGDAARDILLRRHDIPLDPRSEMLLYMAARAQLVAEVIRPALAAGQVVVCDRFLLANVAYQGYGGGLPPDEIWQVGRVATAGLMPRATLLLDMPAEAAQARLGREPDRLEQRGLAYLDQVRRGFLAEAARLGTAVRVIDAARDFDAVQADLRAAALAALRPEPEAP